MENQFEKWKKLDNKLLLTKKTLKKIVICRLEKFWKMNSEQ